MKMIDYAESSFNQMLKNLSDYKILDDIKKLVINWNPIRIEFVASGSSFNGTLIVLDQLKKIIDYPLELHTPEYIVKQNQFDNNSLYILISQSGESTNILSCLDTLKNKKCKILSLTGDENSTFYSRSDNAFYYGAGHEKVGFVTTGVQTLCEFLIALFIKISNDLDSYKLFCKGIKRLQSFQDEIVRRTSDFSDINKLLLAQHSPTFFCGNLGNYGIAKEGALKWQETLKRPAMYYEVEEFLHGPDYQLTPSHAVFLLDDSSGDDRIYQVYRELHNVTDKVFLITYRDKSDQNTVLKLPAIDSPYLYTFSYLMVIQIIAAVLSDSTETWAKHPYFAAFNKKIGIKTQRYILKHK